MKFLSNILSRLRVKKAPPLPVEQRLSQAVREQALEEARFLFSKGAHARNLLPGEEPGDPEVGTRPINTP